MAAKIFFERGYEGTSLDLIAEQMELTKATLYHYFSSKDELLTECLSVGARNAIERLDAIRMARADDPVLCVRELVIAQLEIVAVDAPELSRLFVERREWTPAIRLRIKAFREEHDRIFREAIEAGMDAGVFFCSDPNVARHVLHGAVSHAPAWLPKSGPARAKLIKETADAVMRIFVCEHEVD